MLLFVDVQKLKKDKGRRLSARKRMKRMDIWPVTRLDGRRMAQTTKDQRDSACVLLAASLRFCNPLCVGYCRLQNTMSAE